VTGDAVALTPYDSAKNLAGDLELDYFRRPRRLTRYLRLLTWASSLVCLAVVAYVLLPGHQRVVQAGPLSAAHAMFNDDCARCHQEPFRTATRIWQGDMGVHSVPDTACTVCHPGAHHRPPRDGHAAITAEKCASCHKEHRGRTLLAHVPDGHCVHCHADPTTVWPGSNLEKVSDFAHHPEFLLLRDKATDPGTIHFNHQAHLNLPREVRGIDAVLRRLQEQQCGFCHEPDSAGRYMKPVRYEKHCQECHALTVHLVGESLAGEEVRAFARQPALHPGRKQSAEVVRADLRNRFLHFAQENPKRIPAWPLAAKLVADLASPLPANAASLAPLAKPAPVAPAPAMPVRGIPGSRRAPPVTPEQLGWVDFQLWHAERTLFDGADGCRRCHTETSVPFSRPHGLPEYEQPTMKDRWYKKSRFDHHRHRMLNCLECHTQAAASTTEKTVMLPGVATCQRCHNSSAGVRSDCIECHVFHERGSPAWQGSLGIGDLVDSKQR
jgi:hypothetical protein